MSPLNRREFLFSSVVVSAATALAPHLSAMSSEGAPKPRNPVQQKPCAEPRVQPYFARDSNFVNWREQGLNLCEKSVRDLQCIR
jgi:hypothetical protein